MRYLILATALIATAVSIPKIASAQVDPDTLNLENNLRNLNFAAQLHGGVYLGVQLADITADRAKALKVDEERGVEVVKVEPGSPAESAGIKAGDVLLSYNGENILGAQQMGRLVSETPEGRKVKIQFWRDGRTQTTYAVIAKSHWASGFPGGDLDIQMPDVHLAIPDIPTTLLVWKNAVLGMECEPVDAQLAEYFGVKRGVLVRSVEKGSAAEKAGLKAGDVLTAVGDHAVTTPREVMSSVRASRHQAKPITVALTRDRRQLTLTLSPERDGQDY